MAKWYVAAKKADFNGIGQRFSISPVLAVSYETGTSKEMKQLKNISTARSGICMIRHF